MEAEENMSEGWEVGEEARENVSDEGEECDDVE